jgi:glutathione synthase/RimK-type ligase-like ATP-grasp enzyme
MLLLLLSNTRDLTTDLVVGELRRSGLSFVRLNCDQVDEAHPTFSFEPGESSFSFKSKETLFKASNVTAAYLRRPHLDRLIDPRGPDARYRYGEWRALLEGIYSDLSGRWLNEPYLVDLAENKVRQLRTAASLGFGIPRTIVSNDPARIAEFIKRSLCVVKPLRDGVVVSQEQEGVIFTTRVATISDADKKAIEAAPFIIQEEIPKAADIRVTVVGKSVFATAIESQADETSRVDWRKGDVISMAHCVHDLPQDIADRCVSLVEALGLRFGAIDLVLDRHGRYWFLEINPNGQWGWIQSRTAQPIARAIVRELVEISAL